MDTAVISSVKEKNNFDSKTTEVSEKEIETNLNEQNKEELPALRTLSETTLKNIPTTVKSSSRVLPLVYIQSPSNIKVPTSSAGNLKPNSKIIVNTNNSFQISAVNPKIKTNTTMSSVLLTQTGSNTKSQPIIFQKNANSNAQTLIPVTVATSTGTKQTFAYLGTLIKPQNAKTSENQIVVPTNHLPAGLVPAPTNQKVLFTSVNMPKLSPRIPVTCSTNANPQAKLSSLILPVSLNAQGKNSSVINFKISNSQFHSDPKGAISLLCDSKSKSNLNEKENSQSSDQQDTEKKKTSSSDNTEVKNEKPLSDKVYELSIPEVPTTKCDFGYTLSIPEEKKIVNSFRCRKMPVEPKVAKEQMTKVAPVKQEPQPPRKSLHEVSILKKCNLNSVERKAIIKNDLNNENKTENAEGSTKTEVKQQRNENRKLNPERRRKSQYTYLRDFDEVVVTSGNAWENKANNKLKNFQSSEITLTKLSNVDESKENNNKKMDDFIEIEVVKQELPEFSADDDQDVQSMLTWKDGIGYLPGSQIKFHINEFGFLEMIVDEEMDSKVIKKEVFNGNEILRCSECGCYGMPSEFISYNYCSKTCKVAAAKAESKRAFIQESKEKRKKKKLALLNKAKIEDEDLQCPTNVTNSDEDNNSNEMLHDKIKYPWQTAKKGFSWSKYLDHIKAKAAPVKLFKDPFPYAKNGFRPGMKLEGIDPQHPSYFCVLSVSEVQGYRIRLHFDGYPENYDFWVNADSTDIFPVGWCEKYNHALHPPPNYKVNEFNWNIYLKVSKSTAAPRQLFAHRSGNTICPNGFRLGMKLEAVDKKNSSLICVASVADVLDNRFLVHFDSWDDIYDYWADPTSPYIHPVGWCDQYGHNLTPPNDYPHPETFTWDKYLKETKTTPVPVRAFKQRPSNGFKKDMRLECVDKRIPQLIRVATIEEVRDHQIKVRFDGWPNKYSYWIDDDSPDIHPPGWCQKTGHPLESPLTPDDVYDNFECPTVGCRGVGHIEGPKYTSHNNSKDCPYSDENIDVEFIVPDRLAIAGPEFIQESIIPISREPPEKLKVNKIGRPAKIRRLTETEHKSDWPIEDDFPETNRKRKLSNRESTSLPSLPSLKVPEFPSCPSQQILAKHSKILNDIMSNNSQDPRSWTVEAVNDFVNSLPTCEEYSKLFISHKIDGEAFLMLTQKDLVDILKFKLGPAIKLYNSIVLLRKNVLNFYN